MAWNIWQVPPVPSESEKKKWQEIPTKVFWLKMSILLAVNITIGVLLFLAINT